RSFRREVQDGIEPAIRRIADGVCAALGASAALRYERRYPPTINSAAETARAGEAAAKVVGAENVIHDPVPSMGSEDFAFMLEARPGSYVWLGNGPQAGGCGLHNPHYDFNDAILPLGASYWVQ